MRDEMSAYDLLPCDHPLHISVKECAYAHERMALEARIVRALIRRLKAEGWTPVSVFDGGEYVDGTTEKATLDTVFSVDESTITFVKPHKGTRVCHSVLIVLGNGIDCIPNYGMSRDDSDGWNEAMDRITEELYLRYDR